jgi:hypothetical protein
LEADMNAWLAAASSIAILVGAENEKDARHFEK